MSISIPEEVLAATHMRVDEFWLEVAVMLFSKEKLTLAQAARLAQMDRLSFQHVLASRNIAVHYDVKDFQQDIATLKELGLL